MQCYFYTVLLIYIQNAKKEYQVITSMPYNNIKENISK